ncbi:MAG: META domain-containing protein [Lacibacter sp.]
MLQIKTLIPAFLLLLITGCKRTNETENQAAVLTGKWKLVQMVNEQNGTVTLPPAYAQRLIAITFRTDGTFTGNTIVNDIAGTYKVENGKDLDIMLGFVTKINEDDWGRDFCDVLMSCHYQSLYPCIKPSYEIKNGQLIIHSVADFDLILER